MPRSTMLWTGWLKWLAALWRRPPRVRNVGIGFDPASTTTAGDFLPWCAPTAWVTLQLQSPLSGRSGFTLAVPGRGPAHPEPSNPAPSDEHIQVVFRIPAPLAPSTAELIWRGRVVRTIPLPILDEAAFRRDLHATAGLTARLGRRLVPARVVLGRQCHSVVAAVTFTHPRTLYPLPMLGLSVELVRAGKPVWVRPVEVAPGMVAKTRTVTVAAVLPGPGRGRAVVRWRLGGPIVAESPIRGIRSAKLAATVRLVEAGFATDGAVTLRHPPARIGGPVGPRFTVVSTRPGWAGVLPYEVLLQGHPSPAEPCWTGRVLMTDQEAIISPGRIDLTDREGITGFELVIGGRSIGQALLRPVPTATFDAEGGFIPSADFPWTASADDELTDRLGRLNTD